MKSLVPITAMIIILMLIIALAVVAYIYAENFLRDFSPRIRLLSAECEPGVGFRVTLNKSCWTSNFEEKFVEC